jgi:hypothetical protein
MFSGFQEIQPRLCSLLWWDMQDRACVNHDEGRHTLLSGTYSSCTNAMAVPLLGSFCKVMDVLSV